MSDLESRTARIVREYLRSHPGATSDEVAAHAARTYQANYVLSDDDMREWNRYGRRAVEQAARRMHWAREIGDC